MMRAYGIPEGVKVEFIPIETVGDPWWKQYLVTWLFKRRRVRILRPFEVPRPNGGHYIIPGGLEIDGGSVPRWLLVVIVALVGFFPVPDAVRYALTAVALLGLLIDSYGLMFYAFAVHDFAVRYGCLVTCDGWVEDIATVGQANNVMLRVNFATNDMIALGYLAHLAVCLGAWRAWNRYHKQCVPPAASWRALEYGIPVDFKRGPR